MYFISWRYIWRSAIFFFLLPSNSSVCVPRLRLPMRQRVLQHAPVLRRSQLHFQLQGRRSGEDQESQPCLRRGEDTEDLNTGLLRIDVHPEACAFRWPINHLFLSPFPLLIWSCLCEQRSIPSDTLKSCMSAAKTVFVNVFLLNLFPFVVLIILSLKCCGLWKIWRFKPLQYLDWLIGL